MDMQHRSTGTSDTASFRLAEERVRIALLGERRQDYMGMICCLFTPKGNFVAVAPCISDTPARVLQSLVVNWDLRLLPLSAGVIVSFTPRGSQSTKIEVLEER
jgi:hypothetical protein